MAITTAKVTYSLRPETVSRIEELSLQWGVAKSEVVRRVVAGAGTGATTEKKPKSPLEALDWLQKNGISKAAAAKWKAEVRRERRAWDRKKK